MNEKELNINWELFGDKIKEIDPKKVAEEILSVQITTETKPTKEEEDGMT
jgi:hypothetical protein